MEEFLSLDGGSVRFDTDLRLDYAARSTVVIAGYGGRAVVHSATSMDRTLDLVFGEGMTASEQFDQDGHHVALYHGELFDPEDFRYYGDQFAVSFDGPNERSVWFKAEEHSKKWALDLASTVLPSFTSTSARIRPMQAADWVIEPPTDVASRLIIGAAELGAIELISDPIADSIEKQATSSRTLRVGRLGEIGTGFRRRYLLRSSGGSLLIHPMELPPRKAPLVTPSSDVGAVAFADSLRSLLIQSAPK